MLLLDRINIDICFALACLSLFYGYRDESKWHWILGKHTTVERARAERER